MDQFSERGLREEATALQGRLDALAGDIRSFEQSIDVHRQIATASVRVVVRHEAALVGDSLNVVPWMLALAERYGRTVHAGGQFHAAVQPLLAGMPISFDPVEGPGPHIEFVADVKQSWDFAGPRGFHMLQGYFGLSGMSPPPLPVTLPLVAEDCELPPGVVISPFCGSEPQEPEKHVRVWYQARWKAVTDFLLSTGRTRQVYLLGGPRDDPAPFLRDGVIPIVNQPLTRVLDLMRRADLCIGIDTGTSHIAHYGGVDRHLLLYPEVNFPTIHTNPRARMLRAWPDEISADRVISEAANMLAQRG